MRLYLLAVLFSLLIGIMPTMAQTNTPQPTYTLTPTLTPTPSLTPSPTFTPGGPTVTPTPSLTPLPTDVFWRAGPVQPGTTSDCGFGLPCGPIPWPLPVYAVLSSPSPAPTLYYGITATHTPTMTPTPSPTFTPGGPTLTPTATYTPTEVGTVDPLQLVGTVQALSSVTPAFVNLEGTPVVVSEQFELLADGLGDFFGYFRTLTTVNFGVLQPLYTAFMTGFVFILLVKLAVYTLPLTAVLIGAIRKVVQIVLDIIPG